MSQEIIEAEVVNVNKPVQPVDRKKKFIRTIKIIGVIVFLVALILLILAIIRGVKTYKNALSYKKSHDIVLEQIKYCAKIQNEEVKPVIVHYCDEFNARFNEIEK
jgi:hypothetical protein